MSELIPTGTVNRLPTENNRQKTTQAGVEKTARSKNLADGDQHQRVERRRKGNRRHNPPERRLLNNSATRLSTDRRRIPDRRSRLAVNTSVQTSVKKQSTSPGSKKGRIIDERV